MSIGKGDLAMIVRPPRCCGSAKNIGRVFSVQGVGHGSTHCIYCSLTESKAYAIFGMGLVADICRLKKIDPPAEGDSLPTREELEVAA